LKWLLVVVALVAGAVWLALTVALFYRPTEQKPGRADAVVVLGSRSHPDRLQLGLRLAQARVAPVLVLSAPPADSPLCADNAPFEVICFTPDPFTTRGEAESIGRLAAKHGWRSVVLATSNYHAVRAKLLVRRCFHGSVSVRHSAPRGVLSTFEASMHEWGGLIYALTLARGC
jgi:uncharacterized SAM-binding protein YcdF (DUF218 family)